jgi:hypothetical protein
MTPTSISLQRISRVTVALTAASMLIGALTGTVHPMSVAAGAAVMLANFHLLRFLVSLLIRPGLGARAQVRAFGALVLKLTLAIALVAGVLYQFPVKPLSFAVGSTLLLIAAVFEAVNAGSRVQTSGPPKSTV